MSLVFRRRHAELLAGGAKLSGLNSLQDVMARYGFSDLWVARAADVDRGEWIDMVDSAVMSRAQATEASLLSSSSSLAGYMMLGQSFVDGCRVSLDDRSNIAGTQLLTKCRLGHLLLLTNLGRMLGWPARATTCLMCGDGAETVEHFLMDCAFLEPCRIRLEAEAVAVLNATGAAGAWMLRKWRACRAERMHLMLGGVAVRDDALEVTQMAQSIWGLDKACKNFLVAAWRLRASVVGRLSAKGGRLSVSTPLRLPSAESILDSQSQEVQPVSVSQILKWREFWLAFQPRDAVDPSKRQRKKGRVPFYVVWVGREVGIFMSWRECADSIFNFPGARFRGFFSLPEAQAALEAGPPGN